MNYVREWRNFNIAKICFMKKLCNQKVTSHYHRKAQYLCKALDVPSVQHPSWAGMDFRCVLYARKKTKSRREFCRWPSRKSMAVSWLNSKPIDDSCPNHQALLPASSESEHLTFAAWASEIRLIAFSRIGLIDNFLFFSSIIYGKQCTLL